MSKLMRMILAMSSLFIAGCSPIRPVPNEFHELTTKLENTIKQFYPSATVRSEKTKFYASFGTTRGIIDGKAEEYVLFQGILINLMVVPKKTVVKTLGLKPWRFSNGYSLDGYGRLKNTEEIIKVSFIRAFSEPPDFEKKITSILNDSISADR